jgi:hypothetical protein
VKWEIALFKLNLNGYPFPQLFTQFKLDRYASARYNIGAVHITKRSELRVIGTGWGGKYSVPLVQTHTAGAGTYRWPLSGPAALLRVDVPPHRSTTINERAS